MSRGLGRIERSILEIVADESFWDTAVGVTTPAIADEIAQRDGQKKISRALDASVRRAVSGLRKKGLISRYRVGRRMAWALAGQSSERRSTGESEGGWGAGFEGLFEGIFGESGETLTRPQREQLAKLLGMLSSDHEGERRNAMELLERQRKAFGHSWEEIIVDRKRRG